MPETDKKEYAGIDLTRLIMALLVVYIHFPFLPQSMGLVSFFAKDVVAALAVPFFFAVSGFFLFRTMSAENGAKRLIKTEKRVLRLYVVWSLIYFPALLLTRFLPSNVQFSFTALGELFIKTVKSFFLSYSYVHLWYLPVLLLSLPAAYLIGRRLSARAVVAVGAAVLIFSLCFGNYSVILRQLPSFNSLFLVYVKLPIVLQNTLAFGIPYVFFGCAAAKCEGRVFNNKKKQYIIFFISLFLTALEASAFRYVLMLEGSLRSYLFLPLCVMSVFLIAQNTQPSMRLNAPSLRRASQFIYFAQLLPPSVVFARFAATGVGFEFNTFTRFLFAVIFSLLLSRAAGVLENKRGFGFINKLH